MSGSRDPFILLGVTRADDDAAIKKAFRKLARQFHPDHNPDDAAAAARFRDVAWAYDQIGTVEARQAWMTEESSRRGGDAGLGDDFTNLFGRDAGPVGQSRRGKDIELTVEVSFWQAYHGAEVEVTPTVSELCRSCGGSGAAAGALTRNCPACRGIGFHQVGRVSTACAACGGSGTSIEHRCPDCHEGRVMIRRTQRIAIPGGVSDGQDLVVPGAGEAGSDGHGDLLVTVRVAPSPVFERLEGADLLVEVPVSFAEACLGSEVKLPTPERTIILHLPPGTASGSLLRVKGRGMPALEGDEHGDLYARVVVDVPDRLSSAQRRLVRDLRELDRADLRQHLFGALEEDRQARNSRPEGGRGHSGAR